MESAIIALKDTPIPTILVVAGIAFLVLAIAGQLAGRIVVAPERQRWAAIIGGGLLAIGVALHIVPQVRERIPVTDSGSTASPVQPLPGAIVPPPTAGLVESYRIRTSSLGFNNVEFSVFVNDIPVGVYSSDRVVADITRFIKPGLNKVRIVWTIDPNMSSADAAILIIEAKQGETWSHLITRQIIKTTKAGESNPEIFHTGTTSQ